MKVVVAPDKFRGSLSAPQAAQAIEDGLRRVQPDADVRRVPVADGGDGTVDAAVVAGFRAVEVTVVGPIGEPVTAVFALKGTTAVIEMAEASGLRRLPSGPSARTALSAGSYGTGQLITAALDAGADRVVLGVGGSASTDGGVGLASALGARFLDRAGQALAPGGGSLLDLASIDVSGLDPRLAGIDLILATDVDNPLVGEHGAAHVYAPQKGADPAAVSRLDDALRNLAAVVTDMTGRDVGSMPGAGAAGGIGATAVALLGATLSSGSEILLEMLGLTDLVSGAALVITGEGSLDAQSLRGKAPHGVAQVGVAHGVPVVAVAGRVEVEPGELAGAGIDRAYSLAEVEDDPARRMTHAAELLTRLAEQVARDWLAEPVRAAPAQHSGIVLRY